MRLEERPSEETLREKISTYKGLHIRTLDVLPMGRKGH